MIPSNGWIVNGDVRDGKTIYRYSADVRIAISFESASDSKQKFKMYLHSWSDRTKYKIFEIGDFYIMQNESSLEGESDRPFRGTWLYIASSKGMYSVSVSAEKSSEETYDAIRASIEIGGVPLFKSSGQLPSAKEEVSVASLNTDAAVIEALRKPDSEQSGLDKDVSVSTGSQRIEYSRDLIVLRKVKAQYTDSARYKRIKGEVTLRVTFMANGELGPIKLVKSLDKGLDKAAFDAAKKMKFLPAEINGKTVEVTRPVSFSFNVF